MVFNSPAKAYRTFSSRLGNAPGKTRFGRLKSYFESVRIKDRSQTEWDFEDRLDSGKFFYYPGEVSQASSRVTCFENSAHLLMATRELYPSSNPRLAYVDEGGRGVHSVILFEHGNKLWGGDIGYDFLSPVHIRGSRLVYENAKDKKEGIKFKSLTTSTPCEVAKVVDNLRGPNGCAQYFSEGGQKVLENPFAFRPFSIFMSYDNGELVSDIRFNDFGLWNNTAIRRKYDLNRDKFNVDILIYHSEDWARLTKPRKVCWNQESSKIGGGVLMNQFCSLDDLKGWKLDDFVKQFGSYHWTLDNMAKSKHRSKKGSYFFTSKIRKEVLGGFKKDFQEYLKSLPENFMQHCIDFTTYVGSDYVVKSLSKKKKNARSWKDVTLRGKNVYAGSFTAALRQISKREAKVHRTLDHKVLELLRKQDKV